MFSYSLFLNFLTLIIPSSHLASHSSPLLSSLFFLLLSPCSLACSCPPVSGDLAEAKCFLLSRCRWDCNKACQWEAWVTLSHALCLLSVNSVLHPSHLPHSPPRFSAFIFPPSFVCLFSPISFCSYLKSCSLTCLSCLSLSLSLVSLPTALSGT